MSTPRRCALIVSAAIVLGAILPAGAIAQVTDAQIDEAIQKAVQSIWNQQQSDGFWPHQSGKNAEGKYVSSTGSLFDGGELMMATLAFEYTNTPLDDPKYQGVINKVLEFKTKYNYVRSCRVLALSHLYQRMPNARRGPLRMAIKADIDYLISTQHESGGWRYHDAPKDIDLSNTQLVILAISEAAKCGIEVPREPIVRAHKLLMALQREDGGWNYGTPEDVAAGKQSYGSISAAALASLFLTTELLTGGMGCPCQSGRSPVPKTDSEEALGKGLAWLNSHFNPRMNPNHGGYFHYWLYQAERVGIATGMRYFGKNDWYALGANALLAKQKADGSFGTVPDTAFAVLFLAKGRGTVLYNKLQFEGDWNLHRFDMRNLAAHIGGAKEISALWQVIQSSSPVSVWFDAPVLFITTEGGFAPDVELKKKLRAYTDAGGTLLVEASCGNSATRKLWEGLVKEVWPEWELRDVEKDHPLWSADKEMRNRLPAIQHVHDGIRSIIFYSPADISCQWHLNNTTRQAPLFDLGMNLPIYASDKAPLRSVVSGPMIRPGRGIEGRTVSAPAGKKLTLARLKHGGDPYIGRHYQGLEKLAAFLGKNVKLNAEVIADLDAADAEALKAADLLWMSGRKSVSLSETQQANLKKWLEGGGFLITESVMGDTAFNEELKKTAAALGLTMKPFNASHELLTGKLGAASGYDISSKMEFTRSLRLERIGKDHAELVGLFLGDRLVGVHSPLDVLYGLTGAPAWERRGYEADHAMAVAVNLALQAAARK